MIKKDDEGVKLSEDKHVEDAVQLLELKSKGLALEISLWLPSDASLPSTDKTMLVHD